MRLCQLRNKHLRLINELFYEKELDCILNIPVQFPAFPHDLADLLGLAPIGARLANYWLFPSGTIPATCVREDEQIYDDKVFNDLLTTKVKECMVDSKGLPMGLEIIGKPYHDEQILAVMKQLEGKFQFKKNYPSPKYE